MPRQHQRACHHDRRKSGRHDPRGSQVVLSGEPKVRKQRKGEGADGTNPLRTAIAAGVLPCSHETKQGMLENSQIGCVHPA